MTIPLPPQKTERLPSIVANYHCACDKGSMKGRHATRASTECNVLMTTASQAVAQVGTLLVREWSHPKLIGEPSRPHGLGKLGGKHPLQQAINQELNVPAAGHIKQGIARLGGDPGTSIF